MKKFVFALIALVVFLQPTIAFANSEDSTGDSFSIIWISDTQSVVYYDPQSTYFSNVSALESMGAWIDKNIQPYNIIQAVQTGDAVDNGYHAWQWQRYYEITNKFTDDIPYTAIAGNHELGVKLQKWDAYLALPEVQAIPDYNKFEGGKACFSTFEYGPDKFIIVGAGYGAEEESINWMNDVLSSHSDRIAILLFHGYIKNDGKFIGSGQMMFDSVVKKNPNVRIVLCGHVSAGPTSYRLDSLDDNGDGITDRTVNSMMYNYQSWTPNCGQLRLLTWCSTAMKSAAARSASTAPRCRARCSICWASPKRKRRSSSASCSKRCNTARRRTAASRSASTASPH